MSIHHAMERMGRIVADDQMLEVVVRGRKAFAEPGRVTIPAIERFEWLGDHAESMLFGCLMHECGHATYTDFEVVEQNEKANARRCAAYFVLWNIIEDAFVERKKGADYKGCAKSYAEVHDRLWEGGFDGQQGDDEFLRTGLLLDGSAAQPFSLFLTSLGALIRPYGGRLTLAELAVINPTYGGILGEFQAEIEAAKFCGSTTECIALADVIFDKLQPERSTGDERCAKGQEGDERCAKGQEGDERCAKGQEGDERSVEAPSHVFNLQRYTPEPTHPLSVADALEQRIDKLFDMPGAVAPYVVFSHEFDLVRDFSQEISTRVDWPDAVAASRMSAEALTAAFEAALRAQSEVRPVGGYDHGDADPVLLGEYLVGACPPDRLFTQYEKGEGDDTAVIVVVDCSGSMGSLREQRSKSWLARQTAIALHNAMAARQIAHLIGGFTTALSVSGLDPWDRDPVFAERVSSNFTALREALRQEVERGEDITKYARSMFGADSCEGALQVPVYTIFKGFEHSDARGLMNVNGINYNLDGEAILWYARLLAQRPERRRVMFVLSDGSPNGSRDNAQGAAYLKEAVGRVIDAGIECYGFGMATEHVKEFYPEWWCCADLDDLTDLAVGRLTEVLLRNRQEREWITAI